MNQWQPVTLGVVRRNREEIDRLAAYGIKYHLNIVKALTRLSSNITGTNDSLVTVPRNLSGELHGNAFIICQAHAETAPARQPHTRWIQS